MASNVEFEEDSFSRASLQRQAGAVTPRTGTSGGAYYGNEPKMVRWLMKNGFAKSPRSANIILLGLVTINIIITILVVRSFL